MQWNWELDDWTEFVFDQEKTRALEAEFLMRCGQHVGVFGHLDDGEKVGLRIELLGDEALRTSRIEGEILDRDSLQSSLQRQFGLKGDSRKISAAEKGVAEVLVDVYQGYDLDLDELRLKMLHSQLMQGRSDLTVGEYRSSTEAMKIVSGPIHDPVIHFEAPPAESLPREMVAFLRWFDESRAFLPALARASVAHIYFETLHPFEDGNGRIGRALSELSLSQSVGQPLLVALSEAIEGNKKRYYDELARASRTNDLGDWVAYFSELIVEAQKLSLRKVSFLAGKAKFFVRFGDELNDRQAKVIRRIYAAGPDGFEGGLSASNYRAIAKTSTATTTRDLGDLVKKGIFLKSGERKGARYILVAH